MPRLGLGTALKWSHTGEALFGGTAHDEAVRILDRAQQLGISYVDTAPLFGTGRAEAGSDSLRIPQSTETPSSYQQKSDES
ncbi:MAG: hypothetical protein Ct9H300mP19_05760 [Dehalococcoidia bacterium]|nr:MAG: hypothetical protein Ct9H300mP19_05760 [Dehalococcoidia bacterium]